MERFLQQRQNSGEDALMDELKRMTKEQEQAGEMSPTRMEEIYQTLSPFLTDRQREKMRVISSPARSAIAVTSKDVISIPSSCIISVSNTIIYHRSRFEQWHIRRRLSLFPLSPLYFFPRECGASEISA